MLIEVLNLIMGTETLVEISLIRELDTFTLDRCFSSMPHERPHFNPGVLSPSPNQQSRSHSPSMMQIYQLCNAKGHTALFCDASTYQKPKCHICGRLNHTTWFCFYNDKGPNYIGMHSTAAYPSEQSYPIQSPAMPHSSYRAPSPLQHYASPQVCFTLHHASHTSLPCKPCILCFTLHLQHPLLQDHLKYGSLILVQPII